MPNDYPVRMRTAVRMAAAIAVSVILVAGQAWAGRPESRVLIAGGETTIGGTPTATAEIYDSTTGKFTPSTSSMTVARKYQTATLLNNGKVLITGGDDALNIPLASAELYDPTTDTFTALPIGMNQARAYQTATLLPDGDVLIAGGQSVDSSGNPIVLDTAEVYNPNTEAFTLVTCNNGQSNDCMSSPRYGQTATLLSNGLVLVAGGASNNSGGMTATADLFDPSTDSFTPVPSQMMAPREFGTATLLGDGTLLLAGGVGIPSGNTAEIYDPTANSFGAVQSSLSVTRSHLTATVLSNGNVLLAGGSMNSASSDIYDVRQGVFTQGGTMQAVRIDATATPIAHSSVLIAGGTNGIGTPQSSAEVANRRGTFKPTGSMNTPRAGQTATLLP